ncbi:MAG: hypothetical protein IPM82_20665 [Saprospiraceae bacterium]|nr:hypothetical protein [Saprospiraceae bacterium]
MKRTFLKSVIWAVALVAVVFMGCQKQEATQPNEMLAYQDEIDFLVSTYGFDKDAIEVRDSFLVAEGDMIFPVNGFWKCFFAVWKRFCC